GLRTTTRKAVPILAVLVVIEGVAIVLLAVLVAGLLRSHARVLSALSQQGMPAGAGARAPQPLPISKRGERPVPGATDIVGVTPNDETVSISVGTGVDTLLAFLSGGGRSAAVFWAVPPPGGPASRATTAPASARH